MIVLMIILFALYVNMTLFMGMICTKIRMNTRISMMEVVDNNAPVKMYQRLFLMFAVTILQVLAFKYGIKALVDVLSIASVAKQEKTLIKYEHDTRVTDLLYALKKPQLALMYDNTRCSYRMNA